MLFNAVFDKTHDQHQASARREPGEALQDGIVGGVDLIQAAAGRYHGHRKLLQEVTAQRTPDETSEGVTEKSEAMLLGGARDKMRAQHTGDNLNDEIG